MYDIAICDDASRDAEFLIKRIQRLGKYQDKIRFHEYGSGKELLSAMNEVRFSLIFMDVWMEDIFVCFNYNRPYHNLLGEKGKKCPDLSDVLLLYNPYVFWFSHLF